MWRILTAYLLAVSLVAAHHDGTDHHLKKDDRKALIMLEIEPLANGTKDKRSPQQESQAEYGASPGQYVVRSSSSNDQAASQEVPQDYLNLLQQFLSIQQQQNAGQPVTQPEIQQLLVARNPDPTVVQFTNDPAQALRNMRLQQELQNRPGAQLQQLYFNSQFQQQIPLRPRILRPRPPPAAPAPSLDDYPALSTSSQAHNIHEVRLRASLAGSDPNLAVQSLTQQQVYASPSPPPSQTETPITLLQQQFSASAQDQESYQAIPQQQVVQAQPQQEQVYASSPQVSYVQQPQHSTPKAVSYSSSTRQIAPSEQVIRTERVKSPSRAPHQYLRETSQPVPQQTIIQVPEQQQTIIRVPEPEQTLIRVPETQQTLIRVPEQQQSLIRVPQRQQTSEPSIYLSSQRGRQPLSSNQDEELISQLLSQSGHDVFPGSRASASSLAEEVIKSTTALPPTGSRSAIYVTQRAKVNEAAPRGKITINEVGSEQANTPLPVVHLPTPEGQRPLTQSELQALIDAGFNIQPAPGSEQVSQYSQTVEPQYYQQTTKRQRSYTTPIPPQRNQLSYQSRGKKTEQEKGNVQYLQEVTVPESEQQRSQLSRYQLQGTKPQQEDEEEHVIVYVRRPAALKSQNVQQESQTTRLQIVTDRPDTEEQNIQLVQLPTTLEDSEVRQRGQLTRYNTEPERDLQQTQLRLVQEGREGFEQQTQPTRYESDPTQSEGLRYQNEPEDVPQQVQSYQQEEEPRTQEVSPRFHPIVVAELPTTTPTPSSTPRRRRPRPSHSRIVFRGNPSNDAAGNQESRTQYVLSYDSIPEATSFGTRNRVRGRRPATTTEES